MRGRNPVWWSEDKTEAARELCKNTAHLPKYFEQVHDETEAAEAVQLLINALDDAVQNIERLTGKDRAAGKANASDDA